MRLEFPQSESKLPMSLENARIMLIRALDVGRIQVTEHFKQRGRERGFTTVDAERIVRHGTVVGIPTECPQFRNWRFKLTGISCGQVLEIYVGLSMELDLEFPVLAFITGISKGRGKSCKSKKPVPTRRL